MMHENSIRIVLAGAAVVAASGAWAHPGHAGGGFWPGLLHPLLGLDHLLAMVAVGLWAARLGGRAMWAVPTAFVAAMLAGAALAFSGTVLPAVEPAIAASVLVFGLLVAGGTRMPVAPALALAAAFAVSHGAAHGMELPEGAHAFAYAVGFLLATTLLIGVGAGLGRALRDRSLPRRAIGLPIAAVGLLMAAKAFAGLV